MALKLSEVAQLVREVHQMEVASPTAFSIERTPQCPSLDRVCQALIQDEFTCDEQRHIKQCQFCQLLINSEAVINKTISARRSSKTNLRNISHRNGLRKVSHS